MIESGDLRHRVTLRRYAETTDDYGATARSYSVLASRWAANVEGGSGRETRRAAQSVPEATHVVTLRANSVTRSLKPSDQIVWHDGTTDRTLGIVTADTSMATQGWLMLTCSEKVET